MTVKELKEKLEQFDDNLIVMIHNRCGRYDYSIAISVTRGVNEFDGCVFIDDYIEKDDE